MDKALEQIKIYLEKNREASRIANMLCGVGKTPITSCMYFKGFIEGLEYSINKMEKL